MSAADLTALLPLIVLAATPVVVMVVIAFHRSHRVTALITLAGMATAFGMLRQAAAAGPRRVTALLVIDAYALFYVGLILAAGIITALLAYEYFRRRDGAPDEFYILLLIATAGAAVLAASSHFASLFLGFEMLSVSLYAMIAYQRARERSDEAGLKYLILAGTSSSFLLFGMALVYARTGTMEFTGIAGSAAAMQGEAVFISGLIMIIVGIGFKLALVPFHLWTPDVYEGAPAPVSAFIATVSKGAVFALLLRLFAVMDIHDSPVLTAIFALLAAASMLIGNILALFQHNVKRLLAYSSIAQLGYALVAAIPGGALSATAVSYYLAAYFITILGAFGIVSLLSGGEGEAEMIEEYQGLAWRRPWTAGSLTALLLSLAGIPLTAGFIGKFYVVAAGARSALWPLLIVLVISSAIGLFYYLRVIAALYARVPEERERAGIAPFLSLTGSAVLILLITALIVLGIHPSPLIALLETTVARLM